MQVFQTRGRHLYQAEIMMDSVSKASGVMKVLELLGMDPADAWCFGDSINDVEMMQVCGHAIAMGNAGSMVKDACDYVTDDSSHDGIAKALEYGVEPVTLGKRILRTETAGFTVLSWIMYQLEGRGQY